MTLLNSKDRYAAAGTEEPPLEVMKVGSLIDLDVPISEMTATGRYNIQRCS